MELEFSREIFENTH